MNGTLILLALCQVSAIAQPKFSAPLIGVARDSQKQVRLVHGVAGNFVWREVIGGTTLDWAFSSQGGLVKTDKELLVTVQAVQYCDAAACRRAAWCSARKPYSHQRRADCGLWGRRPIAEYPSSPRRSREVS
jgi:hypothetical protein